MNIPTLCNDAICVTDNPKFAAIISSYFNYPNEYFCVFECPRLQRPDWTNEVIKKTNAIARLRPDFIILADVNNDMVEAFVKYVPPRKIIRIYDLNEIDKKLNANFKFNNDGSFPCKENELMKGLLVAKHLKKKLVITNEAKVVDLDIIDTIKTAPHKVVIDDRKGMAPVITANYTFSINAGLIEFPQTEIDDNDSIYDDIANSRYYKKTVRGENAKRSLIGSKIKFDTYIPNGDFKAKFVTFVTTGVPYGYFFPQIPSTHLFSYPDLGLCIFNNIFFNSVVEGTRSALILDPGFFKDSEINFIKKDLLRKNIIVKELRGQEATVYKTGLFFQWFPLDFIFICSHAGGMDGQQFTIKFNDRDGDEHVIVVEVADSFGLTDEGQGLKQIVEVTQFMGFVSIDGVDWNDKNKQEKIKEGITNDFLKIDRINWQVLEKKKISYVRRSSRIKLADGDYQAMFHGLGGEGIPFVFNNACVSFYEFAGKFIFAGARGYIGTLTPVDTDEAKRVAEITVNKLSEYESFALALWEAQKEVYSDIEKRVYVHFGCHFTNLINSKVDAKQYVKKSINEHIIRTERKLANSNPKDVQRNLAKSVDFLKKELNNI